MNVGLEESNDVSRWAFIDGNAARESDTALMMNGRADSLISSPDEDDAWIFMARRNLLSEVKSTVSE